MNYEYCRAAFLNDMFKKKKALLCAAIVTLYMSCLNLKTLLLQIGPLYVLKILRRAYLTCSGCTWLTSVIVDDSEVCASCLFSVLLRMNLSGS